MEINSNIGTLWKNWNIKWITKQIRTTKIDEQNKRRDIQDTTVVNIHQFCV